MKIKALSVKMVSTPLVPPVKPYRYAGGETKEARSVIIKVITDKDIDGWGETHTRVPSSIIEITCKEIEKVLIGEDPFAIEKIHRKIQTSFGFMGTITRSDVSDMMNGIDMALWDIIGKVTNRPIYDLLGGLVRDKIPITACQGIREPHDAAEVAKEYVKQGFSTIKIKGGRSIMEDFMAIDAIRNSIGDEIELVLDANQGYTVSEAIRLLKKLEKYDLRYFEQPIRYDALDDLARLRLSTNTPIALNESVTSLKDLVTAIKKQCGDVILADFYFGGITGVKKAAIIADAFGIPLAMHCGHDFGVKTAASLHAVGSLPAFKYCMESTYYGQADDILKYKLKIDKGCMKAPEGPGLGIIVDEEKLEKLSSNLT